MHLMYNKIKTEYFHPVFYPFTRSEPVIILMRTFSCVLPIGVYIYMLPPNGYNSFCKYQYLNALLKRQNMICLGLTWHGMQRLLGTIKCQGTRITS